MRYWADGFAVLCLLAQRFAILREKQIDDGEEDL